MKKILLLAGVATLFASNQSYAQDIDVVAEDIVVSELVAQDCTPRYFSTKSDNWFLELGAGINMPFVENPSGANRQVTANYGVGFGKWFSPYFGWRMEFQGGSAHWNTGVAAAPMGHCKTVNGNIDVMWDMFNSMGGVNSSRVFSIVPFLGLGSTFNWDYKHNTAFAPMYGNHAKRNEWLFPVSAGLQFRFRLCQYADFFLQARASFYGDSYNNFVEGKPVDVDLTALGGFSINFGGSSFKSINPCDYTAYINNLNEQVNALRGDLAAATAALAVAEAQLPCPDVKETVVIEQVSAPLLATVRFSINSARITPQEKVNVYNIAQWMKSNDQNVLISGYADKDTGTSAYNMALSKRRAQAVYDMLTKEYGIDPGRLAIQADGSDVQPYDVNNWNRIVIFSTAE